MDSKKITIISIAVFVMSLLVFAATVVLVVFRQPGEPGEAKVDKTKTATIEIGDISTQVGATGRYFKGYIYIDVAGKKTPDLVSNNMPKIKDKIISTISYSKPSDFTTEQGFLELKKRLINNINELLGQEVVVDVFFSERILQ